MGASPVPVMRQQISLAFLYPKRRTIAVITTALLLITTPRESLAQLSAVTVQGVLDCPTDSCPMGKEIVLDIQAGGTKKPLTIRSWMTSVVAVYTINSDVAVILGQGPQSISDVAIINLDKGNVLADFPCATAAISPDHHYIAYIRFTPLHGLPINDYSAVYMALDVSGSIDSIAQQLNPTGIPAPGFPIYPAENVAAHTAQSLAKSDSGKDIRTYVSELRWLSPNELSFFNLYDDQILYVTVQLTGRAAQSSDKAFPASCSTRNGFGYEALVKYCLTPAK